MAENENVEAKAEDELTAKDNGSVMTEKGFRHKRKKKMKKGVRILLIILIVILALIAALFITYRILHLVGKSKFKPDALINNDVVQQMDDLNENVVVYDEGKTVTYNGKTYVYNENVIYLAFMGVDKTELSPLGGRSDNAGQSDTNMILVVDTNTGEVSIIAIPRDSMVDTDVMNDSGEIIGVSPMQLCISYAYGDGKETSCENVLTSYGRIMCGMEFKNYYSLDLAGIAPLNDAVDGVEVNSLETFSTFVEGQNVTLWGDNARKYVQYRNTKVFNSDSMRRKRQIQYVKAFAAKAFSQIKSDFSKLSSIYKTSTDYSCTNLDLSRVTYLASVVLDHYNDFEIKDENIYTLKGDAEMKGDFMEVALDNTYTFETILNVFYNEVTE